MLAFHKQQLQEKQNVDSQSPPSSIENPPSGGRGRGIFAVLAAQRPVLSTIDSESVSKVTESVESVHLNSSIGETEPVLKRGTKGNFSMSFQPLTFN